MNTQYMKVNPSELVIDLPVDEAKVTELMASIKTYGLLQSPNVWLQGMRIIDGFHRVVASQRLGLPEIDCIVTDCDEEAFWDARIIAAKPHANVSDRRLAIWIIDAWKSSEWYNPVEKAEIRDEYEKLSLFGCIDTALLCDTDRVAVAQALWKMSDDKNIQAWFSDKSKKWGVNPQKILFSLGFKSMFQMKGSGSEYVMKDVVQETGISVVEAEAISSQIGRIKAADAKEETRLAVQWVRDKKSKNTDLNFFDYSRKTKQDEANKFFEEQKKESDRLHEERMRYWQSPAGQAEQRKQRLAKLDSEIDIIFDSLESLDIAEFPESLRRLTSLIVSIENKMIEAFPDHMSKSKANPIIAENIRLQEQVKDQQRKIESLERALNSKKATSGKLLPASALSSAEIEKLSN